MELPHLIRETMMKDNLMFVYRGVVTNENSVPLLMLLEKEMENSEFGIVGRKRLFMFVLESLQNVSRHSPGSNLANMSLVVYSKTSAGFTVMTGNVLHNSGINELKSKLDLINKLDSRDIRNVYRQMLSSAEFSDKGGAGLGLIEMARKTGNKLDYDFVKIDDDYSYYVLSKTVDSEGGGINKGEHVFNGGTYYQLEKIMADNNLYLLWSGHISADVGKEMIMFNETKLSEDDITSNLKRRVFSVLVEILENVSKYSPGKIPEQNFGMPVAMIRMEGKIFSVTTGNLILNSDVEHLRSKLDKVNNHDKPGLADLFKRSLSGQSAETESTGNMGLIDMARKSGSKLDYDFEKINDLYSYFTLGVKVEEVSGQIL